MKNVVILVITLAVLAIVNWAIAIQFESSVVDLSIPLGAVAIILSYIFTNKSGSVMRIHDRQIQGETGIRVEAVSNKAPSFAKASPILAGSIIYTVFSLLATFIVYKDYFIN